MMIIADCGGVGMITPGRLSGAIAVERRNVLVAVFSIFG